MRDAGFDTGWTVWGNFASLQRRREGCPAPLRVHLATDALGQ